jgi:hypothetical protein
MFGVIMAVGPGEREVARMHDTLDMLAAHESPEDAHLVLIDDGPAPRGLDPGWPRQRVLRTPLRRRRRRVDARSAMLAATMAGLVDCRDHGVDLALKLDTDAAIIAPFAAKLAAVMDDPELGVVGSYDRTSDGGTRDWSTWDGELARCDRAWQVRRCPGGSRVPWYKSRADRRTVARLRAAGARLAPGNAHCLGGAYAVSRRYLERAELSWRPWVGTGLSEDLVVGILCGAAGLRMRSLVGPGEPFALSWKGLPGTPDEITAGGHSIVHSVKAASLDDERRLRVQLSA